MIPKIIHNIAPANVNQWNFIWKKCYESWKNNFPDFKFILWNDKEDIDNFVKEFYPEYWNLYSLFPFHIMRIDFARLCILFKYGGIYADMDVFCYKNFYHLLNGDIYFLENITEEYTDAYLENSMMASISKHNMLKQLMNHCKFSFINYRNKFNLASKNCEDDENSFLINNITGSGMLSAAASHYNKHFKYNVFECTLFNNRPASYSEDFYTKHIHTFIWGENLLKKDFNKKILFLNGTMYRIKEFSDEMKKQYIDTNKKFEIIDIEEFDFYKDYTEGNFFRKNNLQEIKTKIVEKQ